MASQYVVRFEVDPGGEGWTVTVPEVPGCRSYGTSLSQGRRRIREALGLFVDDAEEAELVDEIVVPAETRKKIVQQTKARARADEEAARATLLQRESVADLVRLGLTRRDAAKVLGLSFQRVQQLAESPPRAGARRAMEAVAHRRKSTSRKGTK